MREIFNFFNFGKRKKKKEEKRNIEVFNFGNLKKKQELQEVLKFPIEIFWNLEASLKSELSYF